MNEDALKELGALADKFDTKKQIEEAIGLIEQAVRIFSTLKSANDQKQAELTRVVENGLGKFASLKSELNKKVDQKLSTLKDGYTPIKGKDYFDGKTPQKGVDYFDGEPGQDGKPGEKGDMPDHKWNGTKLSFEKPDGTWGKEVNLKGDTGNNYSVFGGGGGAGKTVKVYDLSSQLNGVLKTFSLPAFYRILSVTSSSFPTAFRPTTDYTSNASAMTITFTSQIDESSTLAAGQTLIVLYAEI